MADNRIFQHRIVNKRAKNRNLKVSILYVSILYVSIKPICFYLLADSPKATSTEIRHIVGQVATHIIL